MGDGGRAIPPGSSGGGGGARSSSTSRAENFITALASSLRSTGGPTVEEAIARDLQDWSDSDDDEAAYRSRHESALGSDDESDDTDQADAAAQQQQAHVMYRRPSGVAFGASRPIVNPRLLEPAEDSAAALLSRIERKRSRDAERSLLRDNHVLPPKHAREPGAAAAARPDSWLRRAYKSVFGTRLPRDEAGVESGLPVPVTETTALLAPRPGLAPQPQPGASATATATATATTTGAHRTRVDEQWEEAVASGKIRTTWQREAKTIISYAAPLIVTFLLQYSINVASIFAVGRIGKEELGAVSLASMTAVITGYAPIQGLATSLDTLCAQAYGSGHKHLVGLQFQRMTCFLLLCFVPMAVLWWFGDVILAAMIPEPRSAQLAGQYLKVLIAGGPAFIVFEAAKRYVQAQGLFRATTYVLLVAAPLNVLVNWLFVWHFGWGFIGAPLAIVFTENVMPVLLLLYVRFVDGHQCWGGLTWKAWTNWGVMIRLALPGMIMVEAEYLAFEILTLVSSRFGASYLAAQSVLVTLSSTSYQIPFPLSIAASTRIANLVGAGLVDAAKITAKVSVWGAFIVATVNLVLYMTLRYQLPLLFTKDPEVVAIVASVLPVVSVMQVFDGLCAGAHGLLRGIGRQEIGGYVNLLVYYVIALPVSFALALGLDWKLSGLWAGVTLGLIIVAVTEYWFAAVTDWDRAARDAARRNEAG